MRAARVVVVAITEMAEKAGRRGGTKKEKRQWGVEAVNHTLASSKLAFERLWAVC